MSTKSLVTNIDELTPVEFCKSEGIWIKHDDYFSIHGVSGGKARSAYQVILELLDKGYTTMVTAGSRQSPQCEIVSYICEAMGIDCVVFMPFGGDTSVIQHLKQNSHTKLERVRPGYNNIIVARAREYAQLMGYGYIPFGMECAANVEITSKQVVNIPKDVKRIVMPVGSGMSFSSVITGMTRNNIFKPIVGVRVGKDPSKIISEYAEGLQLHDYEIVNSLCDYHEAVEAYVGDYQLDPIYEAKCRPFIQEGDLLWVVGRRLL
jgi:1-aminocyclopropane-1-carboxylate deaminase/D-cysteine desulfhydrase-like pyridoxal-dependent ACC family enzyme